MKKYYEALPLNFGGPESSNENRLPPKLKMGKELDEFFDEQNDYCHKCIDGGNIILCDTCPKVFHKSCLGIIIKKNVNKSYLCPYCTGTWSDSCSMCEKKICDDGIYWDELLK